MDLLASVRRTIRQHQLAAPDMRVVLAVSGGSDSVALAHLLGDLDAAGELRVAGLAHFNHQLRETADRDERLALDAARAFGWRAAVDREDVRARAQREHRSIEDAARTARYAFFERARVELGGDVVAVGHTRDDQAETFLLRLLRGAGPRGLAAIHPRRGAVIRPLLDCRRADLRAYLDARGVAYVEDESNRDVSVPRNRVRVELLPLLEARFNPRIVDVLAAEAAIARDEWRWMETEAARLLAAARLDDGAAAATLDVARLAAAPAALARAVLWRAMRDASGGRAVGFEHVEAAARLLAADADELHLDAPGHSLERIGGRLVLTARPVGGARRPARSAANLFRYPLSIPGEVVVPEARCRVSAELMPAGLPSGAAGLAPADAIAILRSGVTDGPLAVRNRRPGDRFRPVGLGGRKKLQDYFVDRKVPRHERDTVPLVVDRQDRIVWIAGHAIDDAFRVTDPAQGVLLLRLRYLGGPA